MLETPISRNHIMLFSFLKKIQVVIVQSSEELNRKEGGTPSGKKLIVIKEYDITEGIDKSQNSKIISY